MHRKSFQFSGGVSLATLVAQFPNVSANRCEFHTLRLTFVALAAEQSLTLLFQVFNLVLLLLLANCVPLFAVLVLLSATITLCFTPVAGINSSHIDFSLVC